MLDEKEKERRIKFGQQIKGRRIGLKLTQAEMAKKLGVSLSSYAAYEQGERDCTIKNLVKISNILGVSIDDLLSNEPIQISRCKLIWKNNLFDVEENDNEIIVTSKETPIIMKGTFSKDDFITSTNSLWGYCSMPQAQGQFRGRALWWFKVENGLENEVWHLNNKIEKLEVSENGKIIK